MRNLIRWLSRLRFGLELAPTCAVMAFLGLAHMVEALTPNWDGGHATLPNWSEATNWSGDAVPAPGDTVTFSGANDDSCYADVNFKVDKVWVSSGYAGGLNMAGANDTVVYGFVTAAPGKTIWPTSLTMLNDGDTLGVANSGTHTTTACSLDVHGNKFLNIAKVSNFKTVRMAYPGDTITLVNSLYISKAADTCVYLMGGVVEFGAKIIAAQLSGNGAYLSQGGSVITAANANARMNFNNAANGITTWTGCALTTNNVALDLYTGSGTQTSIVNFSGNTSIVGQYIRIRSGGVANAIKLTANTNNFSIAGTQLVFGSVQSNGLTVLNCGSSALDFDSVDMATSDAGTVPDTVYWGTSTLNNAGPFNIGPKKIFSASTCAFDFDGGSGTQTVTLNTPASQRLYDVTQSGAAALTTASKVFVDGDLVRTGAGATTLAFDVEAAGDVTIDGAGALVVSDTVKLTGASSTLHIGSTVGTVTASTGTIIMDGNNSIVDDDKGITANQLTIGVGDTVAISGSASKTYYISSAVPLVMDGGYLNSTQDLYFRRSTTGPLAILDNSASIKLASFEPGANNVDLTIPAMKVVGGGVYIGNGGVAYKGVKISLTGNLTSNNTVYLYQAQPSASLTFNTNGYSVTVTVLYLGQTIATDTLNYNFNTGSTLTCGTVTVAGTSGILTVRDTASWVHGTYTAINNANATYYAKGTHTINNTATLTSNGKSWANTLIINASGKTVTCADAINADSVAVLAGTLSTTGTGTWRALNVAGTSTLNQAGDSLYVADYLKAVAGATYTTDASSRLRLGDGAVAYMGGKSLPITTLAGSAGLYDGGTLAELRPNTAGGDSVKFEALKKFTHTATDSAYWNGAAGSLNTYMSSATGQRCTLDVDATKHFSYTAWKDVVSPDTLFLNDGTNTSLGGNLWP